VTAKKITIKHLTILALRSWVRKPDEALKRGSGLLRYDLKPEVGDGVLFVKRQGRRAPSWVAFVEPGLASPLGNLFNASTSAVLFLKEREKLFALTFGFGKSLLHPESIEPDFGLRVTLNTVDANRLRRVDIKSFQDLTLHRTTQSSRVSPLEAFGLDVTQDILRAVTGEPADQSLMVRLTGADALTVNARLTLEQLTGFCSKLRSLSRRKAYKDRFGWIDQLRTVNDPLLVGELDQALVDAVNAQDWNAVQLGPPEPVDWDDVLRFKYSSNKDQSYVDLDSRDYFATLKKPVTLEAIKRHTVDLESAGTEEPEIGWSVYKTCMFEVSKDQKRMVLSGGRWYAVDKNLAARVAERMAQLAKNTLSLPPATEDEIEDDYNARIAAAGLKIVSLHRQLAKGAGFTQPIELCDLLTSDNDLVHVKPWAASSTMSHMVGQGLVAAEALLWDETYRSALRAKLKTALGASVAGRIPKEVQANKFRVVYALIMKERPNWPTHLPFFCQLHLTEAAERLRRLGFRVALTRISIQ
jgi:uncharacterized protein (TIGR04141 family)